MIAYLVILGCAGAASWVAWVETGTFLALGPWTGRPGRLPEL